MTCPRGRGGQLLRAIFHLLFKPTNSPFQSWFVGFFNLRTMERWKKIPGYEDYEVSDMGRVRSLKKGKSKILKQSLRKGYFKIGLYNKVGRKNISVAKMVAICFLGHTNSDGLVVDHINNDKLDNRATNLQLITQRENTWKGFNNFSSKYRGVCKSGGYFISQIRINGAKKYLGRFSCEKEAAEAYQRALKEFES